METGHVGARVITCTQTYTCATVLIGATLLSRYEKPDGREYETPTPTPWRQSLQHMEPYVKLAFFSLVIFNQSSDCFYPWPLKDDQAKQDVVRA